MSGLIRILSLLTLMLVLIVKPTFSQFVNQEVIFFQDFDTRNLQINPNEPLLPTIGNNRWEVNNTYAGNPTTTDQLTKEAGLGEIGNPGGGYLHISSNGTNANYSLISVSENWAAMPTGPCTHGFNEVIMTFWYLAGGDENNAFGEVYYTTDNGANWKLATNRDGNTKYYGQNKWRYIEIKSTDFLGANDLRFAFKWQNSFDNTSPSPAMSWAIDDIMIIAKWDDDNPIITMTSTSFSLIPNPICHEIPGGAQIFFTISDSLCAGTYVVEFSDSAGDFSNPTVVFIGTGGVLIPSVTYFIPINPISTIFPVGNCYKFRVRRTTPPEFIGEASQCFVIKDDCMDSTKVNIPPAIFNDPDSNQHWVNGEPVTLGMQPACIFSAIDVSFFSWGGFNPGNQYSLELSDSAGNFGPNPIVFGGPVTSTRTWDPALPYLPPPPGSISGRIPEVVEGCNYYLRVASSDPTDLFIPWGPFCIKECDILTDEKNDINICITPTMGFDSIIPFGMNEWDPAIFYDPDNEFQIQLLDPGTMPPMPPWPPMTILSTAEIGIEVDTITGDILLSIPNLDIWTAQLGLDLELKMYYMRIVATNSSDSTNILGSLIRLTVDGIGSAGVISTILLPIADTLFCYDPLLTQWSAGPGPFPPTSQFQYMWDGFAFNTAWSPGPSPSPLLQFGNIDAGWHYMRVREISPAGVCIGPWSLPDSLFVRGPVATITGDTGVCYGDISCYTVSFFDGTYYSWDEDALIAAGATIVSYSNNEICVQWADSAFPYTVSVNLIAIMENCQEIFALPVSVAPKPDPVLNILDSTVICSGGSTSILAENQLNPIFNTFSWWVISQPDSIQVGDSSFITLSPDTTSEYFVVVDYLGCRDTVYTKIEVIGAYMRSQNEELCDNDEEGVELDVWLDTAHVTDFWWDPTEGLSDPNISNPIAKPTQTRQYTLYAQFGDVCDPDTVKVRVDVFQTNFDYNPKQDVTIIRGTTTNLEASGAITYQWTPAEDVNDPTISNPTTDTLFENTTFTVTMIDANGCEKTEEINILVIDEPTIYIPNAFTPNGDGTNDLFNVIDLGIDELLEFTIYDRWGEVVFSTNDIRQGWDGNYKGEPQELGTYVYYVKAVTMQVEDQFLERPVRQVVEFHGDVTLIR